MTKQIFKNSLKIITIIFIISAFVSCNSYKKEEGKDSSSSISESKIIPDTVVQFLISSASDDFRNHQPTIPIDFRNVKIGYIKSSNNEITYVLCGEFLSKENKEWTEFATIKTSGYEQYIGKTNYCQDATMVLSDKNLVVDLKVKLAK